MQRQGEETHFETDEARGASSPNIVRWVLAISLFAAIALLSVIWMTGAATQNAVEGEGTAEGRARVLNEYGSQGGIRAGSSSDTDSIVSDNADEFEAAEPGATTEPGTPPRVENATAGEAPAPAAT
jgi:hypothetical protein